MTNKPIKVCNENFLYQKINEGAYPITKSDWNRIKQMADNIQQPHKLYDRLGSGCIGIATSAFIQFVYDIIHHLTKGEPISWMILIIVIVFSVIGVLLFIICNTENQSIENSGQRIVQEMENMETTYTLPQKNPKGDVQID